MNVFWLGGSSFSVTVNDRRIEFNPNGISDAEYIFASGMDIYDCYYASKIFLKESFEYNDDYIDAVSFYDEKSGDVIYKVVANDLCMVHFGCSSDYFDEGIASKLGRIDVAFLPISFGEDSSAKLAKKIMDMIDANIVIPMICSPNINEPIQLGSINEFLEVIKGEYDYSYTAKDNFRIEKSSPKKRTRVIIMQH